NENQTADNTEVAAQNTAEDSQLATDNQEDLDAEFNSLIKGKYKTQYERSIKENIGRRTKGADKLRAQVNAQQPLIDALEKRYGVKGTEELLRAFEEDELYIRQQATETGESEEIVLSRIRNQRKADEIAQLKAEQANRQKVAGWQSEAEHLKESTYPNLDLYTELGNEDFVKMLNLGVPMKQAYEAIHHDDIVRSAVSIATEKAKKQTEDTIKAGTNRVRENGLSSQAASQTKVDVNNLTGKDIKAILKRVENGETVII
ncbi:MAG: hypothetical protein ACI4IF_02325, partial [Acutalibacteraceae bacterium]